MLDFPLDRVEVILQLLASHFDWPNHHFLPCDPLSLVLEEGRNEFGLEEFLIDLRDEQKISLERDQVISLYQQNTSLAKLMKLATTSMP